jgi:pentatricopeptide repeat protein
MKSQLAELERISELISGDIAVAAAGFESFKKGYSPGAHKLVNAKADLLSIIFAVSGGTYTPDEAKEKKLIAFFEARHNYDDATQVLLKLSQHYFVDGKLPLGEQMLKRIHQQYFDKISPRTAVSYLVALAYSQGMKAEDENQLDTALLGMEKLRSLPTNDMWYFGNYCFFNNCIVGVYCRSGDLEKAKQYLDEAQALADTLTLSKAKQEQVNYAWTWYYSYKGVREETIAWLDKQIFFLKDEPFLAHSLFETYLFVTNELHTLFNETSPAKKTVRQQITAKQEKYMREAVALKDKYGHIRSYEMIWPCFAQIEYQKGDHAKAVMYLNKGLKQFTEQDQKANELNAYRKMHKVYLDWGTKTKDHTKLLKACEYLKKDNDLMLEQATYTNQQKLEAIRNKYELKDKELNEKLLQQKVDAMNKEVQLTALYLQEKTLVLDELKVFVRSLQKKETETRSLINAIAQKIDSVKTTEQDKSYLQQRWTAATRTSNKDLCKLYGQTAKSYEQHRYRVKKKMKLSAKQDLVKHLVALSNS